MKVNLHPVMCTMSLYFVSHVNDMIINIFIKHTTEITRCLIVDLGT